MSAVKPILIFAIVGLFLAMAPSVWAQGGDQGPGTQACGDAQQACEDAIAAPAWFKNRGQMVSACAQASESDEINEDCHSCIVSQVASKNKEPINCGPSGCVPQTCGTFTPGCNPDIQPCFCFSSDQAGTVGACVDAFFCDEPCDVDNSCPEGKACYFNTCCGNPPGSLPVCGPTTCTGIQSLDLDLGGTAVGN